MRKTFAGTKLINSLEDNVCLLYLLKNPDEKTENTTYAYVNIASLKTSYEKACE